MFKLVTLALSLIFALAVPLTAGAQSTSQLDPEDLEGLESGYARAYIADIEALEDTPGAIEEMSLDDLALSGLAAIFTFEYESAAEDAFDLFGDQFAQGFMQGSGTEAEKSEVYDLGNQAVEYLGETEVDDEITSPTSMMIVQEGKYIYVAMILGGADVSGWTRALVEHLMNSRIPDTEVKFNEDGKSTGYVFDILPNEENTKVVQGMVPFMDMDFMEADDNARNTEDPSSSTRNTSGSTSRTSVNSSSSGSELEIGNITSKDAGIGDGSIYVYVEVANNSGRLYSYVGLEGVCYSSSGTVIGTGWGNSANVAPGETVVVTMIFLSVPGCDNVQVRFDSLTDL